MLKEYACSRRLPLTWLILALLFLAMVIVTLALDSGGVRTAVDSSGREIASEPRSRMVHKIVFGTLMAAAGLTIFLLTWNYRIIVSDESLSVRSLFLERQVKWSEIPWCHVYGTGGVFIGNPNGRAMRLRLEFVKGWREAVEEVTLRVPSVRRLRTRRGFSVAALIVGCGAILVASLFRILLAFLLSAVVGAGIAFVFVSVEPKVQRRLIVPILFVLHVCIAALAIAISIMTRGPSAASIVKMAIVLIGGWLYGFSLMRAREGAMRGTPGPDWAREVKPASESVVE